MCKTKSPTPLRQNKKRRCFQQRLLFLRSLISHKNEHTARRPRALEVECVKKTFQWNCAPKRATGSFPASYESKCAARSLSRQAHQTKKALLTWCLPYPGALEVERVEKTFQWNVFSATVPSRKGERIARRLRGQAHQKKKDTAFAVSFSFGALEGTRTPDLLVRSQSLYPAELQAHPVWCCFQSAYL